MTFAQTLADGGPGNNYYVDSVNGSNLNSGTAPDQAWQTLAPVNTHQFAPGDTINLASGSSWTGDAWPGGLAIRSSGTAENPITFRSYGSGPKPVIRNLNQEWGVGIEIDGDWIVLDGLAVQDCHNFGVYIGTNHNIVRGIEVSRSGIGFGVYGQHNLVTRNYAHDLTMVRNTPGGDDDYGAIGIAIYNSYNEVSYNRLERCVAPSYDYGTDGGAFEWWGNVDGSYVHHNWAEGNNGFLEVGGGSNTNTLVAYNVSLNNNGYFVSTHNSGKFGGPIDNFRLENNTVVDTGTYTETRWVAFSFTEDPGAGTLLVRNNIFYLKDIEAISDRSAFTHEHNDYYLTKPGAAVGFGLGAGDVIADPMFVGVENREFHLRPGSPANDNGLSLNQLVDMDDQSVPFGTAPDMGAYEYRLSLGLPVTQGPASAVVQVPITVSDTGGLSAAEVLIAFDNSVVRPQTARPGDLNPSWQVASTLQKPGELRISLVGAESAQVASGILATVDFAIVGAPGTRSALHFVTSSLNGSGAPAEMKDGLLSVQDGPSVTFSHRLLLPLVAGTGR